jgi:hypothetical protein
MRNTSVFDDNYSIIKCSVEAEISILVLQLFNLFGISVINLRANPLLGAVRAMIDSGTGLSGNIQMSVEQQCCC